MLVSKYADEAIHVVAELMRKSPNVHVRIAAAKIILDKTIPDIKAVEVTGENGEPIKLYVNAGLGFLPRPIQIATSPGTSNIERPREIQSIGMAQESKENDNSNNRVSEASVT